MAAHGVGTGRAFQLDPPAGILAGIAMGLNALLPHPGAFSAVKRQVQ